MPHHLTLTPTDGSAPIALIVPSSWDNVSFAQFVTLFAPEPDDARTAAEVLCQLPTGTLDALALDSVHYLVNALEFAADPSPVLEQPAPTIPSVGALPYGLFLLVQQHVAAHPDRPEVYYLPRVLALYRSHLLRGKYDDAQVEACEAALLAAPVTESYAEAAAFYGACRPRLSGTPPTKPTPPTTTTQKSTLGSRILSALGLRSPSTPLPAAMS